MIAKGLQAHKLSGEHYSLLDEVQFGLGGVLDEHVVDWQRYLLQSFLRNPGAQNAQLPHRLGNWLCDIRHNVDVVVAVEVGRKPSEQLQESVHLGRQLLAD